MKKTNNQSGFAHLMIIVIILTVALVGTLGFVFWQNFMQSKTVISKTDSSKSSDTSQVPAPSGIALTEIAGDTTRGTNLAIKYPKTWIMTHVGATTTSPQLPTSVDSTKVTSPDGSVEVGLDVGIGGIGGTCDSKDTTSVIYQVNTDTIPGYPGYLYASYVVHNVPDDVYYLYTQAQRGTQIVGEASCISMFSWIIGDTNSNKPISDLSVSVKGVTNKANTISEITAATSIDNYKIAKRIVQSLYVK